jgi:hypothetical protein
MSGHWLENEDNLVHLMIPMRHDPRRIVPTVILPQPWHRKDEPWLEPRDPEGEDLMWPERFGEFEVSRLQRALATHPANNGHCSTPPPHAGSTPGVPDV